MLKRQQGSAAVESIFSMLVVMFLVLGVIEITFTLYARNVLMASAHEGSRAAIELGRTTSEAEAIATATVRRATGRLVEDLDVDVVTSVSGSRETITVLVSGKARGIGPVPFPIQISARSTSSRESAVP